ncbi:helix-turn-helix transcriptional regulator, partial [Schumannella luteola]
RRQLHLIALTQPAERDLVDRDDRDARVTERLIAGGAVVEEDTTGRLRIAHPLIGEALADDADRADVAIEAATRLREHGRPHERFAATLLELRAGAEPPPSDVVWAAGYAYGIGDLGTAIALAAEALGRGDALDPADRFAAALTSASARSVRGELDAAEADFAVAAAQARTVGERAALAARHGEHLAYRRFDVAAAIAQAEAVQRRASGDGAAGLDADLRLWRAILGQVHETTAGPADAELPPEVAVRGAMAAIMTESMGGRADAAHEAAAALTRVQERMGVLDPAAAAMLGFNEYIHLLSLGEHERALEYAEARRPDAGDGVGLWTCVVAEHLNYNGRLDEALRATALAVDQCRWRDGMGVLALTLALQADTLAKAGDVAGARGILDSLEPAQRSEPKAVMMIAECEAWLAHADGDDARAAAIVESAAEAAAGVGYLLVAAISLGVCIRLGRVERAAAMLDDICARVPAEFGLYTALRDVAVALRDRQPAHIAPAAIRLGRAGMAPTALDAISLALRMRPGAEARHRLETAAVTLSIGVDAPLIQRREAPLLSARQLEMALAAAGRERSREIAERLGVSVRTVDNLLQTVYRKLGVSSRDELRSALVEAGLLAD